MIKVAIHGVPRSGTSWLGEIFNSSSSVAYRYQPLFSYKFKGFLNPTSSREQIKSFFELIRSGRDDFVEQTESRENGTLPVFKKNACSTHIVYKEVRYHHILRNLVTQCPEVRVCLLVRNPYSVINSWLKAPREFRADLGWKINEEWRFAKKKNLDLPEEFNGFEKWKEATQLFLDLGNCFPRSVIVTRYTDLISDTKSEVERIYRFCDLPMTEQTSNFIHAANSTANPNAYSVFRKSVSDEKWRSELSSEIVQAIAVDLVGTPLETFLPSIR